MMNKRDHRIWVFPSIGKYQRRMIQFILNDDIEIFGQSNVKIICQMCRVIPPRQRNDFHCIALGTQIFNQLAVIQIATAQYIERTIDDESDVHGNYCHSDTEK
jgi:hypothetical protein